MKTTLEVLESVLHCPVWRGAEGVNEIGEDCDGCAEADPDRARLCARIFDWGRVEIRENLVVEVT